MSCASLILHEAPKDRWEAGAEGPFGAFVRDALLCEERMAKGVNLAAERRRYAQFCQRIQSAFADAKPGERQVGLSPSYHEVLQTLYRRFPEQVIRARITACFHPPDTLKPQGLALKDLAKIVGLENHPDVQKRLSFLAEARNNGAGVVETPEWPPRQRADKPLTRRGRPSHAATGLSGLGRLRADLSTDQGETLLEGFVREMEAGMVNCQPVNFSNRPHHVIAEALNRLAYRCSGDEKEGTIRVVYMDGSEAEPLLLRCLSRSANLAEDISIHPLRASLVSMRHLDMDERADLAWFRNRKVSASGPFSGTDAYCAQETVALLDEVKTKPFHLHLYQTGLEPAVVGFYRGLIDAMIQRRKEKAPPLRVVPFYFKGDNGLYEPGSVWA